MPSTSATVAPPTGCPLASCAKLSSWWLGLALVLSFLWCQAAWCRDSPKAVSASVTRPDAKGVPTRVAIGIWIADLRRIDSAEQNFSANLVLTMSWRDPVLAHSTPGGMIYNLRDIWHPDWLIANATTTLQLSFPEVAIVAQDGTVNYRQRLLGTFTQPLNLRSFPFDRATFHVHFVMVGQTPDEFEFVPNETLVAQGMKGAIGKADELTIQDWRITELAAATQPYQFTPGTVVAGYQLEFVAERLAQHYLAKVIAPLVLIVIMSWAALWLEPALGAAKSSIAVTSMLTLIAYRSAIGAETPKLPYLTNLDAFILNSSVLVLLTLAQVIITTTLVARNQAALAHRFDVYCRIGFPVAFFTAMALTLLR